MKKILSACIGAVALAGVFASCADSEYDEKYADPSKTTEVAIPQVFTAVLHKGNAYMNPAYMRHYTQATTSGTFSGIIATKNGQGRYTGASTDYYDTRWKSFYDMLTQKRLLDANYNNLDENEKPTYKLIQQLSNALVLGQLHEMLSVFGGVPYNGACTLWQTGDYADAKAKVVYESDVTLYKQILSELKEAGDYLASSPNAGAVQALKSADYTDAHGDVATWQKYVNSLRLRIALHLVNGDCATEAKAAIAEILGSPEKYPIIEENKENMTVSGDISKDDYNFGKGFSQAMHTSGCAYATVSQAVLDAMNIKDKKYVAGVSDPRVVAMLDPNPDGEYMAYDVNMSGTEIDAIASEKNQEWTANKITGANCWTIADSIAIAGRQQYGGNDNTKALWMTAAEVQFSKAEAYLMGYGVGKDEAKAKACFVKGVELSSAFYWDLKLNSSLVGNAVTLDVADREAGYINDSYNSKRPFLAPSADDFTAYANSIWNGTQECVNTQMWLNHFVFNELEAWNITRRTGYPAVLFAKDAKRTEYPTPPHRLPYVSSEVNFNYDNLQDAIKANYKESTGYYTKLFWAKEDYFKLTPNAQ